MRKYILSIIAVLTIGYILKKEEFIYCIGDTFYVFTYLTIAFYVVYILVIFLLIKLIKTKLKKL